MATTKNETTIAVKPINIEVVDFTIRGTTPLIIHAWSDKAKQMMLDKQRKKKVDSKHDIKVPVNDFIESLYWLTEKPELGKDDGEAEANLEAALSVGARFGFPVTGIKQSIIVGAYRAGLDVKQTELRGTFFIEGATDASTMDIAEIVGPTPTMREDMVRLSGPSRAADIRYRGEFKEWSIPLRLKYNKDGKYSLDQIMNMVNYGGFVCGIGEWRPEKDGQFGMYELEM